MPVKTYDPKTVEITFAGITSEGFVQEKVITLALLEAWRKNMALNSVVNLDEKTAIVDALEKEEVNS